MIKKSIFTQVFTQVFQRLFLSIILISVISVCYASAPKREFRGAWIQAVNCQFQGIPAKVLKQTLSDQLDSLASCGINAILFQVRVEGDALYKSEIEPWSRYLTGEQGKTPDEDWDPLSFMVEQCHNRGMEIHAWINPFRAKTKPTTKISPLHQYKQHPDRFIKYGDMVLFNPALKVNRDFICGVAADIVNRYNIDGLHIDDYFYPYPEDGINFNDDAYFRSDSRSFKSKADWRRDNVNRFIEELHDTIKSIKPWVKFGISPFGIYRNQSAEYPEGSVSNGLENYSGLYADILYWIEQGWMDYCIPQVYWNVGNKVADYEILTRWWAEHAGDCPMYIGQDVERTIAGTDPTPGSNDHQERYKMNLQRSLEGLQGSCQWPAKSVVDNVEDYRTILKNEYYNYPSLQPISPTLPQDIPGKVRKIMYLETADGPVLFWTAPKCKSEIDRADKYVVYRFKKSEKIDIEDPSKIVGIINQSFFSLPEAEKKSTYIYVVTALSRVQVESQPVKCKVKL